MLTQFQLKLQANVPCLSRQEWAYYLYAALLKAVPKNLAKTIHEAPITPVSTYFLPEGNGGIWIVNLLGKAIEEPLQELLNQKMNWIIACDSINLNVQYKQVKSIVSADELLARAGQINCLHRLKLCTPTAFKSAGQYQILLTTRLIVQSLLKKWNGCLLECPIEDTNNEGMEAMAASLLCKQLSLNSHGYRLKGHFIPGLCGELTIQNRAEGFHRQLLNALLLFSEFSGIGIKTSLGMGGIMLDRRPH